MKNPFWIVNETRVGHTGDRPDFDLEQPLAPITKSLDLRLCNGFRIWHWPPTPELMDQIVDEAGFLMVDFWIGTKFHQHWAKVEGKSEEEFSAFYVEMLKKAAEKYGDKFFWTITGEPDSQAPNWPVERFQSKSEARSVFEEWVKGFAPAMNPESPLRWYDFLGKMGVDLEKHNIAIHLGYPMPAHYAYEMGVRLVWIECNCFLVEGVQLTVAFARGAANQFRAKKSYWGLDFSPWNDLTSLATSYDEQGRRRGGCTESLLLREWMYTFLSGANLLHEEVSDYTHWIWHPDPYAKLSNLGELASRFGKFVMEFDRGETYRSVAVLLEHDHGWMSSLDDAGGGQVWFGTIPATRADLSIGHFFDLAFPGHADGLKGYSELYAKNPWRTQREFMEMVLSGMDMRPYEKGRLATSRWGDVIDVLLENSPEDVLAEYKVIVTLGAIKIQGELAEKLMRYVRAGGVVIANSAQFFECPEEELENHISHGTQGKAWSIPSLRSGEVSPTIEEFVGFKFTGVKLKMSSAYCTHCDKTILEEGFLAEKIELAGAKVIASAPQFLYSGEPDAPIEHIPLAVENRQGKGRVIVTLPYFMMKPSSRTPLKLTGYIYDHVILDTLPFKIDGQPVQHLCNRTSKGWIVSIFNNSGEIWKGGIVAAEKPGSTKSEWDECGDLQWNRSGSEWKLSLQIPAFDFRILSFESNAMPLGAA